MRFIQYSRKSTEGDERQVQSIPDQNSVLRRLVLEHDLNVVKHFEESKSAKLPHIRPIFTEMLEMIKRGEADAILCWHLNRVFRNPFDYGQVSQMLYDGVLKCIKTPEREYHPGDNIMLMAVEGAMATQYIIDLRKNIARAQDEKARRGWYPFRLPAGYLTNPITKDIDIDPERFPLLRRAWELVLTGGYLVPEVLEKLDAWGYRTHKGPGRLGDSIGRSRLYLLFDNPFYYGEFDYKGERMQGKHQPMVTRSEFEQVQAIIHRKTHVQPKRHSFPFTGLIRCGGCGCLVTAEKKVKHYRTTDRTVTYTYYRCTRSKPCPEPCVTATYIQQEIQNQLDRLTFDPEILTWAETAIRQDLERTADWAPQLEATHTEKIVELERKKSRLLELRTVDEITADEYQSARTTCQAELDQARLALERVRGRGRTVDASIGNLFRFLSRTGDFVSAPEKLQRQVATRLAESYLLTLGKLSIQLHPLLRAFATLEPQKARSQQKQRGRVVPMNPRLWSAVDNIVTLFRETDVAFEPFEFD